MLADNYDKRSLDSLFATIEGPNPFSKRLFEVILAAMVDLNVVKACKLSSLISEVTFESRLLIDLHVGRCLKYGFLKNKKPGDGHVAAP